MQQPQLPPIAEETSTDVLMAQKALEDSATLTATLTEAVRTAWEAAMVATCVWEAAVSCRESFAGAQSPPQTVINFEEAALEALQAAIRAAMAAERARSARGSARRTAAMSKKLTRP
jgi:hypothetical protein